MNFKKFLIEHKSIKNEVDIIYQQILDNVDEGHVDFEDGKLSFSIGKIIKNSSYNNLYFIIRVTNKHEVRLGKDKQDRSVVVVDTTGKLPDRTKLNSFLESLKYTDKIKKQLGRYLKLHHDIDSEFEPSTGYEKQKNANSDFETYYQKLVHAIEQKLLNFNDAKGILTNKHRATGNIGKQEIIKAATKHLLTTEIGSNFNEFKGIVLKLPEADFIKHLDSDAKKKILARLESYYEHKSDNFKDDN